MGATGEHSGPGTAVIPALEGSGGAHLAPGALVTPGTPGFKAPTVPAVPPVTAAQAHHALVSIGILLAFVIVSTILAGANPALGHGILALMLVMLLMQGITHVNPITEWSASHTFEP